MTPEEIAGALRRGEWPPGLERVKDTRVRRIARSDDVLVKLFRGKRGQAARERRALERAAALGLPVSEVLGAGRDWLALRFVPGRPATRADLDALLPLVRSMHDAGVLHRDLHLGNLRIGPAGPLLLDLQRARFLPRVPGWLRRRELGALAHSLGDPLPGTLRHLRRARDARARAHWRSRTRRCLVESSGFTAFRWAGLAGFRSRQTDPEALRRALDDHASGELLKREAGRELWRRGSWILKRHEHASESRAAWVGARGLAVRGIGVAPALAFAGPWLVMEDVGATLDVWVDRAFERASTEDRDEMVRALAGLLARLHTRGIYHADLKANNVVWTPGQEPRLLDYAELRFGRRVSRRRRVKNLAQLNAALPGVVPGSLRKRTLARYVELLDSEPARPSATSRLQREVVALSLRRRHRWEGC